jgi:hypothetical protein
MTKGEEMRRWLRRRRERVERIEDEARELIRLLGGDAYGEALWREQTASSRTMEQEWNLIALAIARRTGRRIGLEVSTQMAMNVVFAPDRKPAEGKPQPDPANPLSELKRILAATRQPFKIQFVGAAPGRGMSILSEVEILASDVSAAIVAAANLAFPPKTVALRILDREGQTVFERHKTDRR